MKKRMLIAAVSLAALAACTKNEQPSVDAEKKTVELEVSVPSYETKADSGESAVSDCQILVYSLETGMLEAHARTTGIGSPVKIQCTVGQKEVVVLGNAPDMSSMVKLTDLKSARSYLSHNAIGSLVMEGSKIVRLTSSSSETINIKRVVSKIRLKSIVTRFEQGGYNDLDFKLKSVYLINVPADKMYLSSPSLSLGVLPATWYCKDEYSGDVGGCDSFLYHDLEGKILVPSVEYQVGKTFYCCPNPYSAESYADPWEPRPTRLVVEAYIGTQLCCYPISLPELKQNAVYDVSLEVTRPGKDEPSSDMEKYGEMFNVTVLDWDSGGSLNEVL